ncbi:hypothetical protein MPTK1_1g25320 [Marchantia polymorpha subsp. ruderalis]|uniref:Uncharacterized protein n=2 Tax=Marchantia polymorpha TaxID=3197 RepID=A0AAF6AU55_MARPO|nr:hypothetical protein MARPO_0002s0339 [Marchantia polymorpha]BBM99975.1 hypothetical protein Mp_1g25320 [Marchantia polymorpha subsp. ruderalis]|eukprot:PTQ49904.1 hypothetical protein MARPO_0002s0339 [Marchantia polymorpha]
MRRMKVYLSVKRTKWDLHVIVSVESETTTGNVQTAERKSVQGPSLLKIVEQARQSPPGEVNACVAVIQVRIQ